MKDKAPQVASRVILIRPSGFGFDPQTAKSNSFQQRSADPDIRRKAEEEFDAVLLALNECGIGITVLDPQDAKAPNAVFPNNWFSTDEQGHVLLYPMATASRRTERDPHLNETLVREGFAPTQLFDFSGWEEDDLALEGTGSLVLDRTHRMAYASLSPRTSEEALDAWCHKMNYGSIGFNATMDGTLTGQPVYHTNVVMSIGERFVLICMDAIPYPGERRELEEELTKTGRELITISLEQMHRYVGNMLQLKAPATASLPERLFIFLSETAFNALVPEQRIQLEKHGQLVPVAIPTIESVGGGSIRCMLAENFLPLR